MRSGLILALALAVPFHSNGADVEIHRCLLEDGTFAFQETPCPPPADDTDSATESDTAGPDAKDEFFDFVNPFDEAEHAPAGPELQRPGALSTNGAACVKTTRDAIDAIDDEMRKGYSKEEGQRYLAELLELTEQLRACKQR